MPDSKKKNPEAAEVDHGKVLYSWAMPEFPIYQRSQDWYFWMGLLAGILILYAVFTGNFLFAVIIVLTALILFARSHTNPEMIDFQLTEDGIKLGQLFYNYSELRDFFIIYNPPEVKTLYFDFKNAWRPHLAIPLHQQNPLKVRKILLEYMEEDLKRDQEPLSDQLSRYLKM